MPDQKVGFDITANNSGLISAVREAQSTMSEFFDTVTEKSAGIGGSLEELRGKFSAAFEFAGIAAAYEGLEKIGSLIESMGHQAAELNTVSDVLGVTTDQLQAMRAAATEAGVGSDVLTHAAEKLVEILAQARNGSGAAADKLFSLGVTAEQINNPLFSLQDLLQTIHDRLNDSTTKQDEMNSLLQVFGTRAALAAEAIAKFDGSAKSVAATMARLSGLTSAQNKEAQELGIRYEEAATKIENLAKKALLAATDLGRFAAAHNATIAAIGNALGVDAGPTEGAAGANADEQTTQQKMAAQAKGNADELAANQQLQHEMLQQEMENVLAGVAAFKQGTAQRLAALKEYAKLAEQYYGSDQVDKVQAANLKVTEATRAFNEEQERQAQELFDTSAALDKRLTDEKVAGHDKLAAMQKKDLLDQEKQMEELYNFSQDLDTRLTNEKAKGIETLTALNKKQADEWTQKWSGVFNGFQSGFSTAISGMVRGTTTFSQAMTNLTSSVLDGFINMCAKMVTQWLESLIYQEVAQKTTTAAGIMGNAGLAATAAMASVAAIPFYGWAMAPATGAATYAEAIGYLASASGGYDIPAGTNPITQLHEREMVLPAGLADNVRDMSGAGSRGNQIHLHVKDAGGGDVIVRKSNLAEMIRQANNRFQLG